MSEVNIRLRDDPDDPAKIIVEQDMRPRIEEFDCDEDLPETHMLAALMLREMPEGLTVAGD